MATLDPTRTSEDQIQFRQLLEEAVNKPGTLMKAYSLFWNYSLGNQILALFQATRRGIPLGPIASFNKWKELGRHVKRGEKAIELCMPVTVKRTVKEEGPDGAEVETQIPLKRFVFRRNWFLLSQTDGAPYTVADVPKWDRARALAALQVEEIPFEHLSGNVQGYSRNRQFAINPLAELPTKTLFHELAHLCCLRSYAVLRRQVIWNPAASASEVDITFSLNRGTSPRLAVIFLGSTFWTIEEQ